MYPYVKAIHIIFIVTWFAGLFYMPRLFIYKAEAAGKNEPDRRILLEQLKLMSQRLWLGITWPSALLTLIFGIWMAILYGSMPQWLIIKLCFVGALYIYHLTLHHIFKQQQKDIYKYKSLYLRIWNEVATIFLVAIVLLVSVKQNMSWLWGITGLLILILVLLAAIKIYQLLRSR